MSKAKVLGIAVYRAAPDSECGFTFSRLWQQGFRGFDPEEA
jgi:hypothetical protein